MKELKATLNDAIITRIKAPFLGSFILCYMSVNIKGIVSFYLGTLEERKTILSNFGLWNLDLLWAFILVFVYIGLTQFALPKFQTIINEMKFEWVTKPHQIQSALDKKAHYDAIIDTNEAKYKSSEEYIKVKLDTQIGHWDDEKKALQDKVEKLEAVVTTKTDEAETAMELFHEKVTQISKITDESLELKKKISDLEIQIDHMKSSCNEDNEDEARGGVKLTDVMNTMNSINKQYPILKQASDMTNNPAYLATSNAVNKAMGSFVKASSDITKNMPI